MTGSLRAAAFATASLVLSGLTACGSSTAGGAGADKSPITPASAAAGPEYIIGPGDALSVFVYRSPELSMEVPVRPDGRVSMPLVTDMVAEGKTPTRLGTDIQDRLKQYVKDPLVTVIVRGFVGPFDRQVRVIGEATEPAAIPYRDHMTVLDVMIATKGLTRYAAGNSAQIIRRNNGSQQVIKVKLSDLLKDGAIDQNVDMQPGDTLIIPQTWF